LLYFALFLKQLWKVFKKVLKKFLKDVIIYRRNFLKGEEEKNDNFRL